MSIRIEWPESVPVLKPENTCEGYQEVVGGEYDPNCGCLIYWIDATFSNRLANREARRVLMRHLRLRLRNMGLAIGMWSDTHLAEERVAAWDELCRRLGYTEEVPA